MIKETIAYVYKWTHIPTLKWYVGSRTANGCHPDDGYICSSKIVKPMIELNPEQWVREIIATGSKEDMIKLEYEILESVNAAKDLRSFNKSNGNPPYWLKNNSVKKIRRIQTPDGIFCNKEAAADYYNTKVRNIVNWIKYNKSDRFYYIDDEPLTKSQLKIKKTIVKEEKEKLTLKRIFDSEFAKQEASERIKKYWDNPIWKQNQLEKRKQIRLNKHKETIIKKSYKTRRIQTPDGIFDSVNDAAEFYSVSPSSIYNKIKDPKFSKSFIFLPS